MKDVREGYVSLWARIVNREITQIDYDFFKKDTSSWVDIDVIGIKPGSESISLYNVKSNINTNQKNADPEIIAKNFRETITVLNRGYSREFIYNLYLIYESADRFTKTKAEERKTEYIEKILSELKLLKVRNVKKLVVKSISECLIEIINSIAKSPAKKGSHCFNLENNICVYPFHKIRELQFLDIYTNYNPKQ
jgi:hypothetical protein